MVASASSAFMALAIEWLSLLWIELTLASSASLMYFILSRRSKPAKDSTSKSPTPVAKKWVEPDQEPTISQLASKALRQGRMKHAVALIKQLPATQAGRVSSNVAFRLLTTVSKSEKFDDALAETLVLKGNISSGALEAALSEALKNGDTTACRRLHLMSNVLAIPKSQQIFQTLASAYCLDGIALKKLMQEAPMPLSLHTAKIILQASDVIKDVDLAANVHARVSPADAAMLRNYGNISQDEQAKPVSPSTSPTMPSTSAGSSDSQCSSPRSVNDAAKADTKDANSAIPKDVAMRANDIRSCGRNGDLIGALKVFDRLDRQTADSTFVINSVVDACVACKDFEMASYYFKKAKQRKIADTITYNTMIKGHLLNGREDVAKQFLDELVETELGASLPSFHGLLNARVSIGDSRGAWKLVTGMQLSGLSPNAVTCSILLKAKPQSPADIFKVLALIDAMEQPMDEVLFLSMIEACVRTKRLDVLSKHMEKFIQQSGSAALTAPTYGSMIKAFGQARNISQVWKLWDRMVHHDVKPTSVTIGCMVEALVGNGCVGDAWKLARKMWNDERTKPFVNTVIYSSILKGFASAYQTEKVMEVYQEMRAQKVQPNTITYNTIFNAFAQNGEMHRVPALLDDMHSASPVVHPDIVTYSTIIKGFCNSGQLDRALEVFKDMKVNARCKPDEVLYNSLLNGCAKEFRPDDALKLLNDMRATKVAPSNYTLSMLVKLMGRCKRINDAFGMLDDISTEYGLKINIQVYTCLIQGCFNSGQVAKAIAVHDKILTEGLVPDSMTYSVLVKGCLQSGAVDKAADLARCAYGKGSIWPVQSKGSAPGLHPGCLDEVVAAMGGACSEEGKMLAAELGHCPTAASARGFDQSRQNFHTDTNAPRSSQKF